MALGSNDEDYVSKELFYILDEDNYIVLNNITLPSNNGKTTVTQIDQVVISTYGIFCIETKSHKGWIFGYQNGDDWTQSFYKKKFKFHNPFLQNYAHIKAIESSIGVQNIKEPVVSLVIFPSAKKIVVSDTDAVGDVKAIINKIQSYRDTIYTSDECFKIADHLRSASITDRTVINEHCEEVSSLINNSRPRTAKYVH